MISVISVQLLVLLWNCRTGIQSENSSANLSWTLVDGDAQVLQLSSGADGNWWPGEGEGKGWQFFACGSLAMNLQKWLESVKTVARTKPNALIRRMQQVTQIILDSCNALHSLRVVRLSQYRNLSCSCHGIPNGILDIFGWLRLQKPPTRSSRRKWRSN